MSVLTLEAKLERQDPSTPWGFRMQGGKDYSSPITIARVTPGSLAAKCGLQQGDIILKIGNRQSETLKHKDAQDAIISYGNKLDLLLQRLDNHHHHVGGGPSYDKFATPSIGSYQSPSAGSGSGPGSQTYNTAPKPFGASTGSKPYTPTDNLAQQTQNLNLNQTPSYSKYSDIDDKPGSASHQSRSFKFLADTLDSGQGPSNQSATPPWQREQQAAPAPPPPAPAKAPPASKPGVWSPGQPAGGAPAAKPFVPTMTPAPPPAPAPAPARAPAAPRAAPPKPSGIGAVRGKIGDAVMKKDMSIGTTPVCAACGNDIRGPFVLAMGKTWCPDCFVCANPRCACKLIDIGFVEEGGFLYCEKDYELYFAPHCAKCDAAIVGECVNALNKQYHPACFLCHHCNQPIGGSQFHLEDGHPYCETHWRQMFQTMCSSCNFPIEPGDKWVEALSSNFHSECFNCSTCQVNLEGLSFYAKGGKPYCKKHAR